MMFGKDRSLVTAELAKVGKYFGGGDKKKATRYW